MWIHFLLLIKNTCEKNQHPSLQINTKQNKKNTHSALRKEKMENISKKNPDRIF